ncbi:MULTISPECIES: hypothetical protein [unclassified Isoptericola]|uniref:hypothetical protein n=1 Tax=unclassified Isoptericola TaxID=2623355 RepID=UPI003660AD57
MAMALRSEIGLPTLRIHLDHDASHALFSVVRGRERLLEVARCPLGELGLPPSVAGRVDDASLTVPDAVLARLRTAVADLDESPISPHDVLWLEIPVPRGQLHVLPWERLLAPLGRPVFRLPFHPVRAERPGPHLDVALCCSLPPGGGDDPAALVARLAGQYVAHTPGVRVHVFTDAGWAAATRAAVEPLDAAGADVDVHAPPASGAGPRARRHGPVVSAPWFTWLLEELDGHRVDVLHLVVHGHLADGHGAFALRPTTTGEIPAFVEPTELVEVLTRVGAVAVTFSAPPGNPSTAGLRELADELAGVRPGLTTVHDLAADPAAEQIGAALHTIFARPERLGRTVPALTSWVHPLFVEPPGTIPPDVEPERQRWTAEMRLLRDGRSAFLQESTRRAATHVEQEAWVASAARSIEQLQMTWLPGAVDRPVDDAATAALERVSQLLEHSVRQEYPASDDSPPAPATDAAPQDGGRP